MLDVAAAALHDAGERAGGARARSSVSRSSGSSRKLGSRKPTQGAEGLLLARVRRCGDEEQVPVRVGGERRDQLVALVPRAAAGARVGAGVGLVDDHELGAGAEEVVAAPVGLDVVGRDDT